MPKPSLGEAVAPPPADETDPRQRLLRAATQVFARQGYERATTREICHLAGANVAAIHYHFGDKAGLYRETFRVPIAAFVAAAGDFDRPGLSLAEALEVFFRAQLAPLLEGGDADPFLALIARETADPSGVLGGTLAATLEPQHRAFEQLLRRHVGCARVDADIELLAVAMIGMGTHLTMARDVLEAMRPKLLSPRHVERVVERLVEFGVAMVERERRRRASNGATGSRR